MRIEETADNPPADFLESDVFSARLDETISAPENSRAADGKD